MTDWQLGTSLCQHGRRYAIPGHFHPFTTTEKNDSTIRVWLRILGLVHHDTKQKMQRSSETGWRYRKSTGQLLTNVWTRIAFATVNRCETKIFLQQLRCWVAKVFSWGSWTENIVFDANRKRRFWHAHEDLGSCPEKIFRPSSIKIHILP